MARSAPSTRMTYADYLTAEERADVRHEFLRGEVFAMAGSTLEHAALTAAMTFELKLALQGRPCRVYSSDARVRSLATDLTTYPDVSVVCGSVETAPHDPHTLLNPIVLVEVLSDTTEAYDRGAKAAHYRTIPSLQEYVLVNQHEPLIEVYRRNEKGRWELTEARAGETVELASLGVRLHVEAVYANPLA